MIKNNEVFVGLEKLIKEHSPEDVLRAFMEHTDLNIDHLSDNKVATLLDNLTRAYVDYMNDV